MRATWFDQGLEKGREQGLEKGLEKGLEAGRLEGRRQTLQEQLAERFGPLSKRAQRRLQSLSPEELASLVRQVLRASSLRELGLDD